LLTIITFIADASSSSGMLSTISLQLHIKKDRAVNSSKFRALKSISYMPEVKLKQLQYESETWKRLLSFMMDENVHLKNRLSEILKNSFDRNLLEEIENFQNRFIKEDSWIGLLRHDVVEFDKLLERDISEDGQVAPEINSRLNKLRNNIINADKEFDRLKTEFNSYLLEKV